MSKGVGLTPPDPIDVGAAAGAEAEERKRRNEAKSRGENTHENVNDYLDQKQDTEDLAEAIAIGTGLRLRRQPTRRYHTSAPNARAHLGAARAIELKEIKEIKEAKEIKERKERTRRKWREAKESKQAPIRAEELKDAEEAAERAEDEIKERMAGLETEAGGVDDPLLFRPADAVAIASGILASRSWTYKTNIQTPSYNIYNPPIGPPATPSLPGHDQVTTPPEEIPPPPPPPPPREEEQEQEQEEEQEQEQEEQEPVRKRGKFSSSPGTVVSSSDNNNSFPILSAMAFTLTRASITAFLL